MKFLKLVNFEFNRISKILFTLFGLVLIGQIGLAILESFQYIQSFKEKMYETQSTKEEVLNDFGFASYSMVINNPLFFGTIFICVGVLLIYIFLIWYRDWFGKNTFIYRLLMLPVERLNIYLAKLLTILLATLSLVGFQVFVILLGEMVMKLIIPNEFILHLPLSTLFYETPVLGLILPNTILTFVLIYGLGVMTVMVIFTAILFERSYRMKGIVFGVAYGLMMLLLFAAPIIVDQVVLGGYLYFGEIITIESVIGILIMAISLVVGRYLIQHKIRV